MPLTPLLPQVLESGNISPNYCLTGPWMSPTLRNCVLCMQSDDCSSGSRIIQPNSTPLRFGRFEFQSLPNDARGGAIDAVSAETTARRGGGSTAGQYRVMGYSPSPYTYSINYATIQPGAPGGSCGVRRTTTPMPTPPDGTVWTQPQVDGNLYAIVMGPAIGTGMNVYYFRIDVTWRGAAATRVMTGISWLGPLIAAGWGGLNLFHESTEVLNKIFAEFKDIIACPGNSADRLPSMDIPEEKEILLNALFVRPKYAI